MIKYRSKGATILMKLFIMNGSVFPSSMAVAFPAALLAALLRIMIDAGYLPWLEAEDSILKETQAWTGFNFLVSFLVVFRTSQSYNRFWDGCTAMHQMRAEWVDACISVFAFTKHSIAPSYKVDAFKATMVRLMSMLHCAALAELEVVNAELHDLPLTERAQRVSAFDFELIDPGSLDPASLLAAKRCSSRVELIYAWIQGLIIDNINTQVLSIPPPILTRTFQEISNGMVAFHDAMKISYIPLPFPYAQACDCLLALHWLVVPFVVSQWVTHPFWAAVFVIIQVFILWALNFIAIEIENPFGSDPNDLDGRRMQEELNTHLVMLLRAEASRTPELIDTTAISNTTGTEMSGDEVLRTSNYRQIWSDLMDLDAVRASTTAQHGDVLQEIPMISARTLDFTRNKVSAPRKERRRRMKNQMVRMGSHRSVATFPGSYPDDSTSKMSSLKGGSPARLFFSGGPKSDSSAAGSASLPIGGTVSATSISGSNPAHFSQGTLVLARRPEAISEHAATNSHILVSEPSGSAATPQSPSATRSPRASREPSSKRPFGPAGQWVNGSSEILCFPRREASPELEEEGEMEVMV